MKFSSLENVRFLQPKNYINDKNRENNYAF